jgi:hypothetical protein
MSDVAMPNRSTWDGCSHDQREVRDVEDDIGYLLKEHPGYRAHQWVCPACGGHGFWFLYMPLGVPETRVVQ